MSDYKIYEVPSYDVHNVDLKFESVGDNTFTLIEEESPSPNFPVSAEDLIKVTVMNNGIQKSIYAVYQNQTYDGTDFRLFCGYDSKVYGGLAEAETDVIKLEYYPIPAYSLMDVEHYNLSPSLSVSTYGKSFTPYNYNESYNISVPQYNIHYNDDFKKLYTSYNEKVLVDSCNHFAYKISPEELSVLAINGKIKTSLNFNVLIK
jgi:hypothetical protein